MIGIVVMAVSWLVGQQLRSRFAKYSKTPLSNGLSGREIAERMLHDHGIHDVKVVSVPGQLTDHYNPANKTVNLSEAVHGHRNAAAAAVAAHECGHAVQHATAYSMLQMRSALVPVVNIAATVQQYLFMFGLVGLYFTKNPIIMMVVLAAFAITALFSLITLPVEFDASKRALVWLENSGVARGAAYDGAKDALTWAAMTYVSAALAALVQFLYLLLSFLNSRE